MQKGFSQIGIWRDDSVGAGVLDGPQISKNGTFGASRTPPPTARQIQIWQPDLLIAQESPRRMAGAFLYLRGFRRPDYSASLLIMSSVTGDSGHSVMLKSR